MNRTHIRVAVMVAVSFLSTLFLALAVTANPIQKRASLIKLRFARRVSTDSSNLVKLDRLRVNIIKAANVASVKNRDVINSAADNRAVTYVASVGVGSPATNCKLLLLLEILTGSSTHRRPYH